MANAQPHTPSSVDFESLVKRCSQVSIVDALSRNPQGNLSMRSPAVRNSVVALYEMTTTPSLRKLAAFVFTPFEFLYKTKNMR